MRFSAVDHTRDVLGHVVESQKVVIGYYSGKLAAGPEDLTEEGSKKDRRVLVSMILRKTATTAYHGMYGARK